MVLWNIFVSESGFATNSSYALKTLFLQRFVNEYTFILVCHIGSIKVVLEM